MEGKKNEGKKRSSPRRLFQECRGRMIEPGVREGGEGAEASFTVLGNKMGKEQTLDQYFI